ncbi:DinB family protein [Sphingobacterium athyrii]|uniref:DinB family protein n=1 Tax=Sphingobacterium athyrii TaxID=2152717 RepID=A0A363NWZ3_9SPHI|nr:DinB family protein [Sphingobacterium athyrii]PUV25260.1 DinB family protein [Sphingobacterium athyrii]
MLRQLFPHKKKDLKLSMMKDILIRDIKQQLRDVEAADLWIDENFEKKLSQVDDTTAFERPIPEMHSMAELASHLIEWRREVLSRLKGNPRGLEMSDAANWRNNNELRKRGWESLMQDLHTAQQDIISFLEGKDDTFLQTTYPHAVPSFPHDYKYLLTGLIHHDMYHLGQMGITIKFLKIQHLIR